MLQFKQPQPESVQPPARWNVGLDRRRVAAYVAIALAAGFVAGFAAARYWTRAQPIVPVLGDTPPGTRQAARDNLGGEFHRVTRVVRGDTIEVDGVGPVRMIGIETPDGKSPREIYGVHGERAVAYTQKTLLGHDVRLDYDELVSRTADSAPTLAYVYTRDGLLINAEMVRQGLAFVEGAQQFRFANDFRGFERDAMQAMRGVWGPSSETAATSETTAAAGSPVTRDKPNKLAPLPPSALGANIPAISGSTNNSTEQSVWVSPSDKLYHKPGCQFLDKRKHLIPLSQARTEGYTACSRCYASTLLKAP